MGADGVELDEGNDGSVLLEVRNNLFEYNGEYCLGDDQDNLSDACNDGGDPDVDDGFDVDRRVEMLVCSDTAVGAAKSTGLGLIGFAGSVAIGVSTWTVKQHWVVDSVYAILLAHIAYLIAIRGYNAGAVRVRDRAFTWRGPALFGGLLVLVYVGYYFWFRLATS